jgi:hypothetical protein
MGKLRNALLALMIFLPVMVHGGDFKITVSASKSTPKVGEAIELRVAMSATDLQEVTHIVLPDLRYFKVGRSSEETAYQPVGGVLKITRTRIISLVPLRPGKAVLKPVAATYKGKGYQSNSLTITIQGEPESTSLPGLTHLFVRSEVSSTKVVVGEPIDYRLKVFRQFSFKENPTLRLPLFQGFFQSIQPANRTPQKTQVDGKTYYVTDVVRRQLYATAPGKFVITDGAVTYRLNPPDSPKITAVAPPLSVEVRPLPTPKPNGFSGAVGHFAMSLDKSSYKGTQFAPISVRILVSGQGNFESVNEVILPVGSAIKWTKAGASNRVEDERVTGRYLNYVLVAQEAGRREVGSIKLVMYSPQQGTYVTVETGKITIDVETGVAATTVLDQQTQIPIRPLRAFERSEESSLFRIDFVFWMGLITSFGLLVASIGLWLRQWYVATHRSQVEWNRAVDIALQELDHLSKSPEKQGVALAVYRCVQLFLTTKLRQPVDAMDLSTFTALLTSTVDPALVQQITSWRESAETMAFSPGGHPVSEVRDLIQRSIRLVEMNRDLGKGSQ